MIPQKPLSAPLRSPSAGASSVCAADGPPPHRIPVPCRRPVRVALYAVLGLFAAGMLTWGILPGLLDPTFEQHILDKNVIAGMTREQTLEAWGAPYQMNVTYTDRGVRREEWVYEDWIGAGAVRHRYLYFEEGILVGGWS